MDHLRFVVNLEKLEIVSNKVYKENMYLVAFYWENPLAKS